MALLAAYSFDEAGDVLVDYSGNGNHASLVGTSAVRTASGHTAGGLTSTGLTPVTLPDVGVTPDRTVMCWLSGIHLLPDMWPIIYLASSIGSGAWGILHLAGNTCIQARNAGGFVRAQVADPVDGGWHHVAGTYDGANVRLYLDAVLVDTEALAGPLRTDTDPPALLGAITSPRAIDDLRIFDEVLAQPAIEDLMNTPVAAAPSGRASAFFH